MLVTTNEHFQDHRIKDYLGQINEQIVIGANIFKDVFASFRDVFGGETKGYKKELDKLKVAALNGLEKSAKELNANGVIGFRMDIDEISGGGKSMFMLNVFGTAVEFEEHIEKEDSHNIRNEISKDELEDLIKKLSIRKRIEEGESPIGDIGFSKLIEFEVFGITSSIIQYLDQTEYNYQKSFKEYFSIVPINEIEELLSKHIKNIGYSEWKIILVELEKRSWFNVDIIFSLLGKEDSIERYRGLQICELDKDYYSKRDIESLSELSKYLRLDLNTDIEKIIEEGTFKTSEYWKCPRCLRNNKIKEDYCTCRANKFGLKGITLEELVNHKSNKVEALKVYFEQI